jgi:hypothetical protein
MSDMSAAGSSRAWPAEHRFTPRDDYPVHARQPPRNDGHASVGDEPAWYDPDHPYRSAAEAVAPTGNVAAALSQGDGARTAARRDLERREQRANAATADAAAVSRQATHRRTARGPRPSNCSSTGERLFGGGNGKAQDGSENGGSVGASEESGWAEADAREAAARAQEQAEARHTLDRYAHEQNRRASFKGALQAQMANDALRRAAAKREVHGPPTAERFASGGTAHARPPVRGSVDALGKEGEGGLPFERRRPASAAAALRATAAAQAAPPTVPGAVARREGEPDAKLGRPPVISKWEERWAKMALEKQR